MTTDPQPAAESDASAMPPQAQRRARGRRGRVERPSSGTTRRFYLGALRLLWEYRRYSLVSLSLTVFQELAALWPARLLGQFVDRLETGDLGNIVWRFLGASVLYPLVLRTNVIISNKMFYEMELQKRVEWTRRVALTGSCAGDAEAANASITRIMNAVSAMGNLAFYSVRSIAPIFVKVIAVSGALLGYSSVLGWTYLGSLIIPVVLTIRFNRRIRPLRDAQYGIAGEISGAGVVTMMEGANQPARARYLEIMGRRRDVLFSLLARSQIATFLRNGALITSQFVVVFIALAMRARLGLTPGDFTTIVGYTGQVAAAALGAASVADTIVDLSRAYGVYAQAHGE